MKKHIVVLMALLVASGTVLGGEINESKAAPADGTVEISLFSGQVTIIGWSKAEVQVTGELPAGQRDLSFFTEGSRTVIEVEAVDDGKSELTVHVPSRSEIRAETLAAGVTVRDVEGIVVIESLAGAIVVEGSPTEVSLATASGPITVRAGALRRAVIESMAGPLKLDADPPADARYELSTVSGPITVRLPASVSARIEADAFSGAIINELGPKAERTSPMLPSQELRFTAGGGGAIITAETVSGPITFAKQ